MSTTRVIGKNGSLSWSRYYRVLVGLLWVWESHGFLFSSYKSTARGTSTHTSHWLTERSRRINSLHSSAKTGENQASSRPLQRTKHGYHDASVQGLDKCSVSFVEPLTGCEVVLVGCFHGSPSSAQDVNHILSQNPPDVLVLELCPERFHSVRDQVNERNKQQEPKGQNKNRPNWRQSPYSDFALRGVEELLRLVNRAQSTFFTGLEPGLEFTTAIRCCPDTDIVLADQPVDQTLWKLSRFPQNAWNMWIDSSPVEETAALGTALFGNYNLNASVNIWDFGTRHWAAQKELVQWILVPLVVFAVTVMAISSFGEGSGSDSLQLLLSGPVDRVNDLASTSSALVVVSNIIIVLMCYLGLILPTTRIILRERDDLLAKGIRAACQVASGRSESGRVTAVLGLLHVNGVTQRLLEVKDVNLTLL